MRICPSGQDHLPSFRLELPALLKMDGVVIALREWSPLEQSSCTFLGVSDKARLAELRSPFARMEFIAGRTALHHAGLALGRDVSGSDIQYDNFSGKPYLESSESCFNFSIAHTFGLACCAASLEYQVGCDCERWDRAVDVGALSFLFGRTFANHKECLVEWTKLEASLKLSGERLIDRMDKSSLTSLAFEAADETHSPPHVVFNLNECFVVSYCTQLSRNKREEALN